MSRWGAPKRTGTDRKMDAIMFIANAADRILLAETAQAVFERYGIADRRSQQEIEVKLLAKQDKLRRLSA